MEIETAQAQARRAYVGGGPGAMISGVVWALAGWVQSIRGTQQAFVVLFIGGMLIFPLARLIARSVFHRENVTSDNRLGWAALESTVAMIGGLFAAWLFLPLNAALVFPLAAIAVGTHYAVFRTVYGDQLFLPLAGLVTCIGFSGIYSRMLSETGVIFLVAVVELAFGAVLTFRALTAGVQLKV